MSCLLGGSMVGLTCHASQVCCSQSPCPHDRPLLTCASEGDTQTLKRRSGSVSLEALSPGAHKVLLEPSTHLWWVWGLIQSMILPLLPSCWGFSFAPGRGLSPHSCSRVTQLPIWSPIISLTEKAMAPHSSTLAWKIPWMEEPGRLQSMGSLRVEHD